MRVSKSVIALILILAVILVGEAFAYLPYEERGFSSDAALNGNTLSYTVDAKGGYDYTVTVIDNDNMAAVDKLYILLDTSYAVASDQTVFTAVGAQPFTLPYYTDQLVRNLKFRGMDDVTVMNTEELVSRLIDDGPAVSGKGLVITSGAIPEDLLETDILEDWIVAGGYLYWVGEEIGKYSSSKDGLNTIHEQVLFAGTETFSYDTLSATISNEDAHRLCMENQFVKFAPDLTSTFRECACFGFSNGTYSTVSIVQLGLGQVCIASGDFSSQQINDLAVAIASGLTYKSTVVSYEESVVRGSDSGKITLDSGHGNLSVYISVGKYFCPYAERYDL